MDTNYVLDHNVLKSREEFGVVLTHKILEMVAEKLGADDKEQVELDCKFVITPNKERLCITIGAFGVGIHIEI